MRSYSQEEWDARELEVQHEITKSAKLREMNNWHRNDPVGQKAWKAMQKVVAGEYDPDAAPLTKAEESALDARDRKIAELEGIVTEINGRTQLAEAKSAARKAAPWLTDEHIQRGVAHYAENGGNFLDSVKVANFDDWVAHANSSSGAGIADAPRGAVDTSRAPAPAISSDPYEAGKQIEQRINAKIAATTGG